jgi:proteasome lid subunit RPN8/RPN11
MKEEFIEQCWFIYGIRVKGFFFGYLEYHSAGSSGHVEFDWEQAMNPLLIGWVHTHPDGYGIGPSETDNSTMRGWVRGKNRSLICGILCSSEEGWYDYYRRPDGEIDLRSVEVRKNGKLIKGKIKI